MRLAQVNSKRYYELKKKMDLLRDNLTIKKYKILSEAYLIGKKELKGFFSIKILSEDFELPITTCKRILSLRKANRNTWKKMGLDPKTFKKVGEPKISAFKAAMVLLRRDTFFQDEMIDLVIEKNYTTYDIKNMPRKFKSLDGLRKERLKAAVKKGFARRSTAYNSFSLILDRLDQMLLLKIEHIPEDKRGELIEKIRGVIKRMIRYVEANKNNIKEEGK